MSEKQNNPVDGSLPCPQLGGRGGVLAGKPSGWWFVFVTLFSQPPSANNNVLKTRWNPNGWISSSLLTEEHQQIVENLASIYIII